MAKVKGQCIPSADRYLYEASLQPATEKSGVHTNKYSTVKYKKTTYRSNYYIRMRYPFELPHVRGADDIHSATLKEIASGDPYPWRKKHEGKPSAKQLYVRNVFKKGVACFTVQPKEGSWDNVTPGPRPRPWWYDNAVSASLYYYNYFMHKTLIPLHGLPFFHWLTPTWYTPTRRATDFTTHRPQEFIKLDEQPFLDFYVEMTVLYNWHWTAATHPDEIAHACCKAVFEQIANQHDTPCDMWQTPGETSTLREGDSEDKAMLTYAMIYLTLDTLGHSEIFINDHLRCVVYRQWPFPHSVTIWRDYENFYRALPTTGITGTPGSHILDCPFLIPIIKDEAYFVWDKFKTRKAYLRGDPSTPEWCYGFLDKIYVADTHNNRIQIFSSEAEFLFKFGTYGTGPAEFRNPMDVCLADNHIFVTDHFSDRIQKFTTDGIFILDFGSPGSGDGQFHRPMNITSYSNKLYITETVNDRIQIFDFHGNFISKFGSPGSGDGQFKSAYGIAVKHSRIYIVDIGNNRVQIFNLAGDFISKFGSRGSGNGEFNYPWGISVNHGRIYIADQLNHRIQIFDTAGAFISKFGTQGSEDGQFERPAGIFAAANRIIVTDYINHRVQIFDLQGKFIRKFGSFGFDDGKLNAPRGLFVTTQV